MEGTGDPPELKAVFNSAVVDGVYYAVWGWLDDLALDSVNVLALDLENP